MQEEYFLPKVQRTLDDPSASDWLKSALKTALARDSVDAANDAEFLCALLADQATALLHRPCLYPSSHGK